MVGGEVDEKVYICANYEGNLILILALDLVAPKIILAIGFGFFVCACVRACIIVVALASFPHICMKLLMCLMSLLSKMLSFELMLLIHQIKMAPSC